MKTIIALNLLA